jgi:cobaltochelatase CobN
MKHVPVVRDDGKLINVVPKRGHLFTCQLGCCCGQTERGFAPSFPNLYHTEWERRKLRNRVHLTHTACLGPCALANVALLLFDGHALWFHSLNTEALVIALYEYIEALLAAEACFPPPPVLREHYFDGFLPRSEQEKATAQIS